MVIASESFDPRRMSSARPTTPAGRMMMQMRLAAQDGKSAARDFATWRTAQSEPNGLTKFKPLRKYELRWRGAGALRRRHIETNGRLMWHVVGANHRPSAW